VKVSIIAVGSELLLGQIANTNGQYLSKLLNGIGHSVLEHAVVGDNPERLERVVTNALNNNDTVILTGGLGPTKDDLTKHTVANILGRSLVTDDQALTYIEDYFKQQDQVMTPNNKQQALVIEGSKVLENKVGMAPGMLVETDGKRIALLPGPPKEMQPMAKNELLPHLLDGEQVIFSELLRFAGIGESRVETELIDLIDDQSNPTIAPLAGTLQDYNDANKLKGMLPHFDKFITKSNGINNQLAVGATIVKDLFETEMGIALLYDDSKVYLGILSEDKLHVQSFNIAQSRNLIKSRTPNYALIRLLNFIKH
jgi:molybdenum cofactor synthesis domain-containing protein